MPAKNELFGAGVMRCTYQARDGRFRRFTDYFCESEVKHLDLFTPICLFDKHNVRRFEIAMNNVPSVVVIERRCNLTKYTGYTVEAGKGGLMDFVLQRAPFQPFHHDVSDTLRCQAGIFDVDNVFVVELAGHLGFALKKRE